MVSEKPPRRSKAIKQPVTIDLAAEEKNGNTDEPAAIADPVRSNDSDEAVTPEELTGERPELSAHEGSALSDEPVSPPAESAETPLAEDGASTTESPASKSEPAPPTPGRDPEPPLTHRSSPAATTLVASGIFGGIVALALAGSMQYAGYLPGASKEREVDTSAFSAELSALRQEVAALKDRPAPTPDAALADRVAALEASSASADQSGDQAVGPLRDEIAQLRSAVDATATSNSRLEDRLQAVEARLDDPGPEQDVARAVAAAALKAAIDRGGPFEPELQTFANTGGDDQAVAALQPFAATGVASRAELQQQFPQVANAMLDTLSQPDPGAGIMDRLLASAMSVVKVRRVGDAEGTSPEAVIARLEEVLRSGDLPAAAREWEALPEGPKNASREFKQKLDARIQVEDLVGTTLARAITGTQG